MLALKLARCIAPLLAIGLGLSCRFANEVDIQELEGIWSATEARFVEIAAPKDNNVDIIEFGFTVSMIIDGSGGFILTITDPEESTETVSGTMVVDGKDLVLTIDETTSTGEVFLEGEQVAFRLTAGLEFDFGHGEEVPTRLLLVMDRVSVPQN